MKPLILYIAIILVCVTWFVCVVVMGFLLATTGEFDSDNQGTEIEANAPR